MCMELDFIVWKLLCMSYIPKENVLFQWITTKVNSSLQCNDGIYSTVCLFFASGSDFSLTMTHVTVWHKSNIILPHHFSLLLDLPTKSKRGKNRISVIHYSFFRMHDSVFVQFNWYWKVNSGESSNFNVIFYWMIHHNGRHLVSLLRSVWQDYFNCSAKNENDIFVFSIHFMALSAKESNFHGISAASFQIWNIWEENLILVNSNDFSSSDTYDDCHYWTAVHDSVHS